MELPQFFDIILHWAAVVCYAAASVANCFGFIFRKKGIDRIGSALVWSGLTFHSLGIVYRWILAGHGPYISRYEILSSNAWVLLVLYLFFARIYPRVRVASIVVLPATFLLIGLGMFTDSALKKLPPTLNNIWLVLHVSFYKIALATLVVGLAFSIFLILKKRSRMAWLERIPDNETNDIFVYRFAGFGFIFWAIAMLSGSIWAYDSWGRFWGWDAIEIWSLVTWILFGIYLHLRRFYGLKGERAAWFYIFCFIVSLLAVFLTPFIDSSIHSSYFR